MIPSRRKLPSLNALRAFEVSGRRLSFSAAAEELGVTQGAIAQQVRALEAHLGQALFQRLPRGLALTQQGVAYLTDLTHAFDVLAQATGRVLQSPDTVTISVTPTFATKLLIPHLVELNAAFPDLQLRTLATEALSDFDRDQVDMAVRLLRPPIAADLEALLLFRHELIAVASPHLLDSLDRPLSLRRLASMPLLHDAHGRWPAFLQSEEKLGGAVFNQTTLALDAAMAGQGVALACRAFVAADLAAGRLQQASSHSLHVEPDYYLVRKKSSLPRTSADAVWHWCAECFSLKEE